MCTICSDIFITFDCGHKCCKECYAKINKCHMCRAEFNIIKIMKVDVIFESKSYGDIRFPFYFDVFDITSNHYTEVLSKLFIEMVIISDVFKYETEDESDDINDELTRADAHAEAEDDADANAASDAARAVHDGCLYSTYCAGVVMMRGGFCRVILTLRSV